MLFHEEGFDPEKIAFLEDCLDTACGLAPKLANVECNGEVRKKLALAILEGVARGMRARDELIDFALRSLPPYRLKRAG
ncbi:hypothetical protein G3545_04535 [Starkeya sp. ORNL1]|uniref:hypothetical protein n=1 Tax=Starkeya sp. ORNL1 TaxID=2709380 RepID=UPI001462916A|nr:hypothetical protein [Starkeya sp. ORNL1]QJP12986.1 hypothetical protein G3545_04535 [Starkeya sp. ORNL1]